MVVELNTLYLWAILCAHFGTQEKYGKHGTG